MSNRPNHRRNSGPARSSTPAAARSSQTETPKQQREFNRRYEILQRFADYQAKGFSQAAAARLAGSNYNTIYRWSVRIHSGNLEALWPSTGECGRRCSIDLSTVPIDFVERVQRLQLTGKGNAAALREAIDSSDCPPALLKLRTKKHFPRSLLALTRLTRRRATVLEGKNFQHICK